MSRHRFSRDAARAPSGRHGGARVAGVATAGVPPRIVGMGPRRRRAVIEPNEALAAQGRVVLRDLGLSDDDARVDPDDGAMAPGHRQGASGARRVTPAISGTRRSGGRCAPRTLCIGVGQGIARVVERVRGRGRRAFTRPGAPRAGA